MPRTRSLIRLNSVNRWLAWCERAGEIDRDEGNRSDGLTTSEVEEIRKLRREIKQLRLEREILAKAAAWFARETDAIPPQSSSL